MPHPHGALVCSVGAGSEPKPPHVWSSKSLTRYGCTRILSPESDIHAQHALERVEVIWVLGQGEEARRVTLHGCFCSAVAACIAPAIMATRPAALLVSWQLSVADAEQSHKTCMRAAASCCLTKP